VDEGEENREQEEGKRKKSEWVDGWMSRWVNKEEGRRGE